MKLRRAKQQTRSSGPRQVVSGGRPTAFSYHANRAEQDVNLGRLQPRDQDNRHRERLVRYWRQRLGMLLAGIILIICVLDILHLSSQPSVIAVTTSTNNTFLQPTKVYERAAQKLFAGSLLNSNKITINTDAIQTKLKKQFPELADVSVTLPLMSHRPIVYIAPSDPALLLKTSRGDYILDTTGRALLTASQADNLTRLAIPVVTDQSGLRITPGASALPSSSVAFITTVLKELQAKQVSVDTVTLPTSAYELDIKPKGAGYFVKFNMHNDTALQQTGTYLAVRERLASQNVTPSSYIDVRLDGRAYYK